MSALLFFTAVPPASWPPDRTGGTAGWEKDGRDKVHDLQLGHPQQVKTQAHDEDGAYGGHIRDHGGGQQRGDHVSQQGNAALQHQHEAGGQHHAHPQGGSEDGGIDILLETIDGLGFYEKIMVQTKCRDHASITETEVRGFYGSLNVLGGSRGIFITSTDFHPGAKKLLDSIDNCIGIDGDTLFELIKKTEYGICKVKNGYTFDTSVFAK